MATNANPYVVNIVPLQGIATGITSSSDTAKQITDLQNNVANIQTMVDYTTHTISTDFITGFTQDQTIQITENINLSSVSLYQDGTLVSLGGSNIQSGNSSISCEPNQISFITAGSNILQLSSTETTIAGTLRVSDDAYVRQLFQTSDKDMKEDIMRFTTCLDEILKLEPCTFKWKNSGTSDIGFISQDVQKVWPSLTENNSLAYSRFVPLLLEGLRELHERVSALENQVKDLSNN
jgi:hypothetical protein